MEFQKNKSTSRDKNSLWNDRNSNSPHGCPLNEDPADGELKMHDVVELYADNNQIFIDDFTAVFEKMLENGYQKEDLISSPTGWMGKCTGSGCSRV